MVVSPLRPFLTRQLLRYHSQFRKILSRPIQHALGRPKLTPSIRLAKKIGSPTKLHPRKRVTPYGHHRKYTPFTPKRKVKVKSINPEKLRHNAEVVASLNRTSFEPVLTMSITDLYHATQRALSKSLSKDVTAADKAMLAKLHRVSFEEEIMAATIDKHNNDWKVDVAATDSQQAEEHDVISRQLVDEDKKRMILAGRERADEWNMNRVTEYMELLVKAARRGEKLDNTCSVPSSFQVDKWSNYETKLKEILDGKVLNLISIEQFPWPILNTEVLEVGDYEAFLTHPLRPGYERLYWYERVDKERALWDAGHVEEKFLPFVEAGSRDQVVRNAEVIRGYLDIIVEKYTQD